SLRLCAGSLVVTRRTGRTRKAPTRRAARRSRKKPSARPVDLQEIESLRAEIRRLAASPPPRWNANPEAVRRSVAKLVLTLIEVISQILERGAIRQMDAGSLTAEETEPVGLALMRLEETIRDLAAQFDLAPEDLNIDLGPIGRLT